MLVYICRKEKSKQKRQPCLCTGVAEVVSFVKGKTENNTLFRSMSISMSMSKPMYVSVRSHFKQQLALAAHLPHPFFTKIISVQPKKVVENGLSTGTTQPRLALPAVH